KVRHTSHFLCHKKAQKAQKCSPEFCAFCASLWPCLNGEAKICVRAVSSRPRSVRQTPIDLTMTKMLTHIEAMVNGEAPPAPVARLVGFDVISVKPGEAVVELQTSEKHFNPMGTVHGGILCDIADAAMGIAYAANLGEGESFTTLELKINYLKPVWNSRLRATARVV